jgi:hypothetical protein
MRTHVRSGSVRRHSYLANTCSPPPAHQSLRSTRSVLCAWPARSCCSRMTARSTGRSTRTSPHRCRTRIEASCAGGASSAAPAHRCRPTTSACRRWSAEGRSTLALMPREHRRVVGRPAPGVCPRARRAPTHPARRRVAGRPATAAAVVTGMCQPLTWATSGSTRRITRCSPGCRKGYSSLSRYFLAMESMCSSAPSCVRSAIRPRTSRYS